jgi:hypothetical protein
MCVSYRQRSAAHSTPKHLLCRRWAPVLLEPPLFTRCAAQARTCTSSEDGRAGRPYEQEQGADKREAVWAGRREFAQAEVLDDVDGRTLDRGRPYVRRCACVSAPVTGAEGQLLLVGLPPAPGLTGGNSSEEGGDSGAIARRDKNKWQGRRGSGGRAVHRGVSRLARRRGLVVELRTSTAAPSPDDQAHTLTNSRPACRSRRGDTPQPGPRRMQGPGCDSAGFGSSVTEAAASKVHPT